jgi:4-amino-4-deoxy-L-arabinose transferase-like glycosyltransferase
VKNSRTDWLVLAGFCGFLFFFGLAYFGLVGADEPRYAQVAREMLARHDWVTPALGGKPWLEKPPLYYWQAMLIYSIFGVSDWSARLPSAIDATLLVVAIYLFLKRFRPGFQLDGALMTASAAGIVGFARAASTDMPLAAMFTIALLAWNAWYESESRVYLTAFYFFLALGTLAKGPIAPLLAAIIIVSFAIAKTDYRLVGKTFWLPGVFLFCAVASPWYIAVQIKNPEFFRVFILQHNLARFGTNLYHHPEPFWYYVPVLLLGLIPWTVFVAASVAEIIRALWAERQQMLRSEDDLNVFLAIWLAVPVVIFSLSQSKLPGYIVPALPAGTLLLAEYVRRRVTNGERPGIFLLALHSMIAVVPVVLGLMIQHIVMQHRLRGGKEAAIAFALAAVLAIGVALTLSTKLGLGALRFVALVPVLLVVWAILGLGAPALDSTLSVRPLANEISRLENKPLPLAVSGVSRETEYGLAFYRNQIIDRYESGQIPAGEHLLVAPEGSQTSIARAVAGRRVSYLGSFAPQGLDYYWVSAVGMPSGH